MRVLGVDPGLTRCGLAVVEVSAARKVRLICAEVVRTSPDDELGRRLLGVEEGRAGAWDVRPRFACDRESL